MIASSGRPAEHHLFIMAKPPEEVVQQIAALSRTSRTRPSDLLHMTVQPVLVLEWMPADMADDVRRSLQELCGKIDAPSGEVVMNRIVESAKAVTLRGTMHGASEFHAAICAGLGRNGLPLLDYHFAPHITLAYRADGRGHEFIEPIRWVVEQFLLVESIYGETRHIELGRWSLRSRQGELFS
jgi:2'-5' RNA ligase